MVRNGGLPTSPTRFAKATQVKRLRRDKLPISKFRFPIFNFLFFKNLCDLCGSPGDKSAAIYWCPETER
jgi:hypothetical protein